VLYLIGIIVLAVLAIAGVGVALAFIPLFGIYLLVRYIYRKRYMSRFPAQNQRSFRERRMDRDGNRDAVPQQGNNFLDQIRGPPDDDFEEQVRRAIEESLKPEFMPDSSKATEEIVENAVESNRDVVIDIEKEEKSVEWK
jgi:hypothetical protein